MKGKKKVWMMLWSYVASYAVLACVTLLHQERLGAAVGGEGCLWGRVGTWRGLQQVLDEAGMTRCLEIPGVHAMGSHSDC